MTPDQHKTRSSLATNAFVCSVMSCSEVSSRGCLVASDQHVRLQYDIEFGGETSCILKVGLENPPKKKRNYQEKVSEKTSFRVGIELKKVQKQDRVRKPQEPYPTTEQCRPPLWPPTQCTCIPSSLCYSHNKAN